MMKVRRNLLLILTGICLVFASQGFSQDEKSMSMEEALKLAQPGLQHELFNVLVGRWDQDVKATFEPGKPTVQGKGTGENKLILGGRFLQMESKGEMMGLPIESVTILGHDNRKGIFTLYGIDTFGTYAINPTGTYDPAKKLFTFKGVEDDPMSGRKMDYKILIHIVSPDKNISEIYFVGPDGKEFKAVETIQTRK